MSVEPFKLEVAQDVLDDLRDRIGRTRWPDAIEERDWRLGTPPELLKRLCDHWGGDFDWRAAEARLNALPQFRAEIDGVGLHLLHVKSDIADATPLLITNGWPSSIFEYLDIIPRLAAAGFHVVAPALPGYGLSDRPDAPGMNTTRISALFAGLMTELGYDRFLVHGSDMGAGVAELMRRRIPERLIGVHFSNVYFGYPPPDDPSPEEKAYLDAVQGWQASEGAYAMIQGTKPQTLSYGLNDSPAGLAGWIVEKFQSWSDGDAEAVFGLDGLCANLTLYWATETIGSSVRLYAESFADGEARKPPERSEVPVGVIVFPKDISAPGASGGSVWSTGPRRRAAAISGHRRSPTFCQRTCAPSPTR